MPLLYAFDFNARCAWCVNAELKRRSSILCWNLLDSPLVYMYTYIYTYTRRGIFFCLFSARFRFYFFASFLFRSSWDCVRARVHVHRIVIDCVIFFWYYRGGFMDAEDDLVLFAEIALYDPRHNEGMTMCYNKRI